MRKPAAVKLVKQLLELRLTRVTPLSDKFFDAMADIVLSHELIDEVHERMGGSAGRCPEPAGAK